MNKKRYILSSFGGRLIGNKFMKDQVCSVLMRMPQDIIDYVIENCWVMSSMSNSYAYTFTGNDLIGKHMIFLSDDLFSQSLNQIHYTIAHEIGHVILGHENSIRTRQSREEIKKQEKEADLFARKYQK